MVKQGKTPILNPNRINTPQALEWCKKKKKVFAQLLRVQILTNATTICGKTGRDLYLGGMMLLPLTCLS